MRVLTTIRYHTIIILLLHSNDKITRLPDVSDPSTIVRAQPSMLDDVSPSMATSVGSVGVVMPGAEAGVAEHDS